MKKNTQKVELPKVVTVSPGSLAINFIYNAFNYKFDSFHKQDIIEIIYGDPYLKCWIDLIESDFNMARAKMDIRTRQIFAACFLNTEI